MSESSHQSVRVRGEKRLHADRAGEDLLLEGARDELIERLAVGGDAVGQGILAGDFHDAAVGLVYRGRLLDGARLEAFDVETLRVGEGVEDIEGDVRMRGKDVVLDHHEMVD